MYEKIVSHQRVFPKEIRQRNTTFTKLRYFFPSHQTSWKVLRPKSKEQDRNVQLLNGYMNHEILINSQGSDQKICLLLDITCVIYTYVYIYTYLHPFSGYSTAICSHLNVHWGPDAPIQLHTACEIERLDGEIVTFGKMVEKFPTLPKRRIHAWLLFWLVVSTQLKNLLVKLEILSFLGGEKEIWNHGRYGRCLGMFQGANVKCQVVIRDQDEALF